MTMRRGGSVANRRKERERKRRQERQQRQPQTQPQPQRAKPEPESTEAPAAAISPVIPSEKVPVDSRAIRWWQYNQESQTFSVEYVTGGVYAYRGVPARLIDDALYGFPTLKSPKGLDFG